MATVYVSIGLSGPLGAGGNAPVFAGVVRSETVSSSGTAASGSLTAGAPGTVAQVVCDTAVYANGFGTASASAGVFCPAGVPTFFEVQKGSAVSVIDA